MLGEKITFHPKTHDIIIRVQMTPQFVCFLHQLYPCTTWGQHSIFEDYLHPALKLISAKLHIFISDRLRL